MWHCHTKTRGVTRLSSERGGDWVPFSASSLCLRSCQSHHVAPQKNGEQRTIEHWTCALATTPFSIPGPGREWGLVSGRQNQACALRLASSWVGPVLGSSKSVFLMDQNRLSPFQVNVKGTYAEQGLGQAGPRWRVLHPDRAWVVWGRGLVGPDRASETKLVQCWSTWPRGVFLEQLVFKLLFRMLHFDAYLRK